MKYPRLSPEDEKAFLSALSSIWSAIGYDILQATAEEKNIRGKSTKEGMYLYPAELVTIRRSVVIDVVTDQFAGGNLQSVRMEKDQYNRIRDWMMKTPSHIVDNVVKKEFSYKWYGA